LSAAITDLPDLNGSSQADPLDPSPVPCSILAHAIDLRDWGALLP
jgi:hypothetical protein